MASLNPGESSEFESRITSVTGDGANRLLVVYSKINRHDGKTDGSFFKVSRDAGSSFGPERKYIGDTRFIEGGLAVVSVAPAAGGTNLLYLRSSDDGATWRDPLQINDEEGSVRPGWGGGFSFAQPSGDEVYCLWTDRRRGFISLFFSASSDGGRTWSPNQAVEYDFREGEQSSPRLVLGAERRLIAIWIDWRDRKTLADIRSSYSDDGGRHWSASQRVNDDTEHVWQIAPSAVALGKKVFVAFQDFREAGEEWDYDWNIYFARSDDNATSWAKNVRLNDVQPGEDSDPRLAIDEGGKLCCAWKSGRASIFGDIAASISHDGGRTWSASVNLDEDSELMTRNPISVTPVSGGSFLCLWNETGSDFFRTRLASLEPIAGEESIVAPRPNIDSTTGESADAPSLGERVFFDDFSDGNAQRWQVKSGVWTVVDGAFMGVAPATASVFLSLAQVQEPDRYVVTGRFKLDTVAHHIAYLYFRSDGGSKFYQIVNQFRFGAWMGLQEGKGASPGFLSSRPLEQRRFPFQNNRWYQFTLAVTPERVDYSVDGRLMLSYTGKLELQAGRFGIGGAGPAPTHFDDIVISRLAAP